jgi:pimeloyl-ACP methyl ester carboxylesterase
VIAEKRIVVGGAETRYLEVEGPAATHPVLFVHGNPTNAEDWEPFLSRLDGRRRCLAPDLIGWGKSDRPHDFHWTMDNLAAFLLGFLDALAVERFDVVVHDWGGIGLLAAQRRPAAVDRVVVINSLPWTSDYRWHWLARLWRRRGVGELMLATTTRFGSRLALRQATGNAQARRELADRIHDHLDAGTKRAILELYRDADPEKVGERGRDLDKLTGPALVVWGDRDPYIGPRYAEVLAEALGGEVRVEHFPDAGHWVWLDRPDAVEMVARFLAGADH